MKQILVAVDEHPHAEQIVDSGIELAKGLSAKILLIYVLDKSSVPENYRDEHGDALPEHYYEDEFKRTVGPLVRMIEKAGIKCEGIAASGDPVKEIMKAAKSKNVSYIVMGTRELRGLGRLRAIGSVSRNVIEKSTIPVVAVP
ncbi:MAG TPA: universal stress protein [Nitrososphaerales archaeon]|nr:universal stress protein [Nitrososphaerales archaeon]